MDKDKEIVVCDSCLCACCIQGELYCDDYREAGTKKMTIGELIKLGLESPDYWRDKDNG